MAEESYFREIISFIKKEKPSKKKIFSKKTEICKKFHVKRIPTDIEILMNADEKDIPKIRKYLLTKPTRSISGVSVVAVMTKPIKCPHGACLMCPSRVKDNVPQSYTGKEPAARRAIRNNFDPYLQVMNRLEQYAAAGHPFDKTELIVMGGTFPSFPKKYRESFIAYSLKAMNDFSQLFFRKGSLDINLFRKFFLLPGKVGDKRRTEEIMSRLKKLKGKARLKHEQERNDRSSKVKCIGMTIETRSDYGKLKQGNHLLSLGCTRVELGIQSVYDEALKRIERGHTAQDNIDSIKTLKDLGFKLNFHYMPGLPGVKKADDLRGMLALFTDERYRPDMLKIYPCMVVKQSRLYKIWKKGDYKPLTTQQAASLIAEFKQHVPPYCRIMRVQRDIPTNATEAGVGMTNLRQEIQKVMKEKGWKCRCIRCREIGRAKNKEGKMEILTLHYPASGGNEFFISAEVNNSIAGFCRLRFPSSFLRKEIDSETAIIRELHVYGEAAEIGKEGSVQHKGIGKALLAEAEKTAKTYYKRKILIISGIGARGYYRKLGYRTEGPYMSKRL